VSVARVITRASSRPLSAGCAAASHQFEAVVTALVSAVIVDLQRVGRGQETAALTVNSSSGIDPSRKSLIAPSTKVCASEGRANQAG